ENIENLKIEHKSSIVSKYITVSMGLFSDYSKNIIDIDDIYKKADKMLYLAKETGRNRVINEL
ncbi:MAG: diguanylate cyclase, partial [Aliarcobacter skirrowii]